MKKLLKIIFKFLAKFINPINNYYLKWQIFGRVPLGLVFTNNFFRKILRINSEVKFPINFTSRVISFKNLEIVYDSTTICSFALSGACYFQALNGIKIGKNFLFAPGVKLISSNHDINDKQKVQKSLPIVIGDNVWLGANVVILPGIKLGNNVIVGAGSIVTKSFPDNVIIAGNPAVIIKNLND
jgi:acetyltransferase-like isoleucine patch superfamily enzyme